MVQSTVSAAVGRLEHELAQPLFRRTGHRIVLTEAGTVLLDRARALLASVRDLREELTSAAGPLRGTVTLGTALSTGTFDLAPVLAALRREHPAVQVRVRFSALEHQRVADGTDDLALVPEPARPTPGINLTRVGRLELLLTAALDADLPAGPLRCADIAGAPFIDFPTGWANRIRTDDLFAEAGVERDVTIEVIDAATAIDLVRGGVGLAFLPRRLVEGRTDLRIVALDAPVPPRPLVLARPEGPQRPAVEAVHRALVRRAAPDAARLRPAPTR
ncbi:LysR family transcriptional regulator [Actinoallomurus iriomotensis]|uniref:LysR family transcriptional regulator n=1 Tax=Actinoallomurus iriomotensis TaxID=478107 RepID=A0A9W6W472_9ACTN|nr:LysR family transcriptional regulator [Actinoallomurus iriomotensis]